MRMARSAAVFLLFVLRYLKLPVRYSGSEAMFADLGHFSQLSIKVIFSTLHMHATFRNFDYENGCRNVAMSL